MSAETRAATRAGFDRSLMAPMVLGAILNPINSSMIAVALVPIGLAFGASPSQTAWLIAGLYLATAVGQPVVGRLVDSYGPRPVFLASTSLVGVAGVVGALAPSLGVLVGARVLLGIGTCAGYPAAMHLIRSEADRTGQASPSGVLTTLAVSSQTIAVVGPTLGGFLIGLGGWRTIFAVNVPLSLACLVLGVLRLPGRPRDEARTTPRLDVVGIVLFTATLTALLLLLMDLRPDRWWLGVLCLLAAAGLAVRELGVADPFIDLRVLGGNLPLLATYGRNLLAFVVSYGVLYGYTQWLEEGRGLSASRAGLLLLPMFLTAIVVSTTTGRDPRIHAKLVAGGIGQVATCVLLLLVTGHSAVWLLVVVALVAGVPQGLVSLGHQNAVYHQADPERMGSSAGLLRTSMYLGAIIASAATGSFLGDGATSPGLHRLAAFVLVVAGLFLAATLADRSLRRVGVSPS